MQKITLICGPTASGKTAAAIELAQEIDAEIISADSGQIYRGLDIGTAKPSLEEQERVRFHLIDVVNPDQLFSAAEFAERAGQAIQEIQSRGKKVLIVGGTGLYLKALEYGLFEGPSRDPQIRQELEDQINDRGVISLHQDLLKVDPEAASQIPSTNRHRLIRALEVYRITGQPISELWKKHSKGQSPFSFEKIGINPPKEILHQRIDERVERMIQKGLLKEVEGLLEKWGACAPGLKIIGYKEMIAHLHDQILRDEAIELIKVHTRQYAKRQMTWFKKDSEIRWEKSF